MWSYLPLWLWNFLSFYFCQFSFSLFWGYVIGCVQSLNGDTLLVVETFSRIWNVPVYVRVSCLREWLWLIHRWIVFLQSAFWWDKIVNSEIHYISFCFYSQCFLPSVHKTLAYSIHQDSTCVFFQISMALSLWTGLWFIQLILCIGWNVGVKIDFLPYG